MLFNLLSAAESASDVTKKDDWSSLIMMGVLIIVFIAFMIYNKRSQKKRQEEAQKQLDAIKPGTKVKTIGGICGTVVEICKDDAFILETGSDKKGKSYIKFDKQAVYQSDAVVEDKKEKATKEDATKVEEPAQEEAQEEAKESKDEE